MVIRPNRKKQVISNQTGKNNHAPLIWLVKEEYK